MAATWVEQWLLLHWIPLPWLTLGTSVLPGIAFTSYQFSTGHERQISPQTDVMKDFLKIPTDSSKKNKDPDSSFLILDIVINCDSWNCSSHLVNLKRKSRNSLGVLYLQGYNWTNKLTNVGMLSWWIPHSKSINVFWVKAFSAGFPLDAVLNFVASAVFLD